MKIAEPKIETAFLLFDQGKTAPYIAQALGCSARTVRRYRELYRLQQSQLDAERERTRRGVHFEAAC